MERVLQGTEGYFNVPVVCLDTSGFTFLSRTTVILTDPSGTINRHSLRDSMQDERTFLIN